MSVVWYWRFWDLDFFSERWIKIINSPRLTRLLFTPPRCWSITCTSSHGSLHFFAWYASHSWNLDEVEADYKTFLKCTVRLQCQRTLLQDRILSEARRDHKYHGGEWRQWIDWYIPLMPTLHRGCFDTNYASD